MKRLVIFLLCGLFCAGIIHAQSGETESIMWMLNQHGVLILTAGDADYIPDNFLSYSNISSFKNDIQSVVIEDGITGIGNNAFSTYYITSISIPASVTEIHKNAFSFCRGLTSISVEPTNIKYSSEDDVLFDNDKMTLIAFPAGKTGNYTIPESVEIIDDHAFGNSRLTSVVIPASVTTIGGWAFYGSYITSLNISSSVISIGPYAFLYCYDLISISVNADNPVYSSEEGVLFNKDKTTLVTFPAGIQGSYTIPESVKTIGKYAFWYSFKLTSVTIPQSVTSIGELAFNYCLKLTSVIIPASVNTIGDGAFYECTGLTSVVIPASVTNIGNTVFSLCGNLSEIVNLNTDPQIITSTTFDNSIFSTCTLRVPAGSLNDYMLANEWEKFINIVALDAGMTLDEDVIYLMPGATAALTATVSGDVTSPEVIRWESDNTDIAAVDHTGTITAVSPGSAVITAFLGDFEATCAVTVVEEGDSSIEGTVYYEGTEDVTVNLYMRLPEETEQPSLTKAKVVGGYVLLTKTVPKSNGQYSFEELPTGTYLIDVDIHGYTSEFSPELNISERETRSGINFTVNNETRVIVIERTTEETDDEQVPETDDELTSGTDELSDTGLSIYPNPFYGLLHIEGAEGSTVRIFSTDGRLVYAQTVTGVSETVHVEHLPAGLYIIRLDNGRRVKIIKTIKN